MGEHDDYNENLYKICEAPMVHCLEPSSENNEKANSTRHLKAVSIVYAIGVVPNCVANQRMYDEIEKSKSKNAATRCIIDSPK